MFPTQGTREQWQSAFYVAAAIYFFGAIYFCFMGLGEIQEWAKTEEEKADTGMGLHELPPTVKEEDEK
jgi:ACS family sodium-dependent inorganic phosphate cotransporter-like MFS transporter 5